jgi:hypothetical protein
VNKRVMNWTIGAIALLSRDIGKVVAQAPIHQKSTRLGNDARRRDTIRRYPRLKDPSRFLASLTITPYNNDDYWPVRAQWFFKWGYMVAMADTRAR